MRRKSKEAASLIAAGLTVASLAGYLAWRSVPRDAAPVRSAEQEYRGDGRFIDRGPRAAIRRYVLDLGELDLTAVGSRKFSLAGLPPEKFTVGLHTVVRPDPGAAGYVVTARAFGGGWKVR